MKKRFILISLYSLLFFSVLSCAVMPPAPQIVEPPESVTQLPVIPVQPPQPAVVFKPQPPVNIMSGGMVPSETLALFLLQNNPAAASDYIYALAKIYVEEAAFEGVNHDIAFSQMCLETGFQRYGGLVTPDQYNFAGLGATGLPGPDGSPDKGLYFPDPRIGVRAQIQHLKAYASTEPLNGELVNPRFRFVQRGSSPTIEGLAGTWAADRQYAVKINDLLQRLYDFAFH